MSKNGIGTIKKAMKDGKRPKIDERNYLYKCVLKVLNQLKPKYFIWENVDRMFNTFALNNQGDKVLLVDEINEQLKKSDILENLKYIIG